MADGSFWDSGFWNAFGSSVPGIIDLIGGGKNKNQPPTVVVEDNDDPPPNNTPLYIGMGVFMLLIVGIMIFALRK